MMIVVVIVCCCYLLCHCYYIYLVDRCPLLICCATIVDYCAVVPVHALRTRDGFVATLRVATACLRYVYLRAFTTIPARTTVTVLLCRWVIVAFTLRTLLHAIHAFTLPATLLLRCYHVV